MSASPPPPEAPAVSATAPAPEATPPSPPEPPVAAAPPQEPARVSAPRTREQESPPSQPDPADASVSQLVKQLSEQSSALARQELRLAQLELQEKGKKAGIAAGMFGAAGIAAFFGIAAFLAGLVSALDTELKTWASAMIVGLVLIAVAVVAALAAKKQINQATPLAPKQAARSVKGVVERVKESARR